MDDIPSNEITIPHHPTPLYRQQFTAAMVVAARKVEKTDTKEETPTEMFVRISAAKLTKENKRVKSAAKKLVKTKQIKKISTFFLKK